MFLWLICWVCPKNPFLFSLFFWILSSLSVSHTSVQASVLPHPLISSPRSLITHECDRWKKPWTLDPGWLNANYCCLCDLCESVSLYWEVSIFKNAFSCKWIPLVACSKRLLWFPNTLLIFPSGYLHVLQKQKCSLGCATKGYGPAILWIGWRVVRSFDPVERSSVCVCMFTLREKRRFSFLTVLFKTSLSFLSCPVKSNVIFHPFLHNLHFNMYIFLALNMHLVDPVSTSTLCLLHIPYLLSPDVWVRGEVGKSRSVCAAFGTSLVSSSERSQRLPLLCSCSLTKAMLWLAQGLFPTCHSTLPTSLTTNLAAVSFRGGSWSHFSLLLSSVFFPWAPGSPEWAHFTQTSRHQTPIVILLQQVDVSHPKEIESWSWGEKAM